jgi:hemerythrin-like domain-containing protein
MRQEHAACDDAFVATEAAVLDQRWDRAVECFGRFERLLRQHLQVEEQVLFPAIEQHTGMTAGPTQVMRMDHDQMRALLGPLEAALSSRDADRFLGLFQSLMVLHQQHNMKEEQVLYPMADQVIPAPEELVDELRSRNAVDAG